MRGDGGRRRPRPAWTAAASGLPTPDGSDASKRGATTSAEGATDASGGSAQAPAEGVDGRPPRSNTSGIRGSRARLRTMEAQPSRTSRKPREAPVIAVEADRKKLLDVAHLGRRHKRQ